ncbi:aspartate aminotransferase-like [Diadema antillarum]|uniref:aspartate aminotransferase-like n=1 Tax=Diadema antillarum TaxID=105358 RepID=UPI003A8C1E0E
MDAVKSQPGLKPADSGKTSVTSHGCPSQSDNSLVRPHLANFRTASNLFFNEAINKMRAEGRQVYHFAFGQSPFPVMEGAKKVLREHAGENAYLPVQGLAELRANICSFHARLDGLTHLDQDLVVVGPGSKQLIYLLMNVFNGDILLLSPTWTTYRPQAVFCNQRVFIIHTSLEHEWKLTPDLLEQTILQNDVKPNRLLVLCNPDNPTGTAYNEDELIALSAMFRKHNVTVISDEIYGRLSFDGRHHSLIKYYPEGSILTSGISKWASAGGWRLGYSIYPRRLEALFKAVCSGASNTYSCAPGPVQHASISLFKFEDEEEQYVHIARKILHAVASYCYRELTAVGLKAVKPTGGFYIFPDFEILRPALAKRGINTGDAMCKAILAERSVALMAGGPDFLRPGSEFTVRLCYVNFDGTDAMEAVKLQGDEPITDEILGLYCRPVVEGIQALVSWVQDQLQPSD